MKKYLIILFFYSINFHYSNAQEILNLVASIYVDRIKIDKNSEDLLIKVKQRSKDNVFQIQYQEVKSRFSIYNSELNEVDSISIRINSFAKKRDIDICEAVMYGSTGITVCIRCKKDSLNKSRVMLFRQSRKLSYNPISSTSPWFEMNAPCEKHNTLFRLRPCNRNFGNYS